MICAGFALALLFSPLPVPAEDWPTISGIDFAGNDITRPETMRRELLVHVGDPADPEAIERSRQAVQDLGLFRWVAVERKRLDDGTIRLTFVVHEKWYILPLPRVEGNSNGDYGYGGQVWVNVPLQ